MSVVLADEEVMRQLLQSARTIAVVGHSDKPHRTSYQIAQYLRRQGYRAYPVNPKVQTIDGEQVYPSVQAIPTQVDIVNVFRRSEHLMDIVEDAIAANARAIWAQLGVVDEAAAQKATEAGLTVVMNRCIKVEHMRLL